MGLRLPLIDALQIAWSNAESTTRASSGAVTERASIAAAPGRVDRVRFPTSMRTASRVDPGERVR